MAALIPPEITFLELETPNHLVLIYNYESTHDSIKIDLLQHSLTKISGIREKIRILAIEIDKKRDHIDKVTGKIDDGILTEVKEFIRNCKDLHDIILVTVQTYIGTYKNFGIKGNA